MFNSIFLCFFDLTIVTYTFVRDKIYLQWIAVILKIRSYIKLSLFNQKELAKTVEHKNSNKNYSQMNNADCSNLIKYLFRCIIYYFYILLLHVLLLNMTSFKVKFVYIHFHVFWLSINMYFGSKVSQTSFV